MSGPARLFVDARSRRTALAVVVLLATSVGAATVLLGDRLAWLSDPVAVRSFLLGFGPFAPAAFVVLQAGQVVLAPVPGQVLALASGWLFGALPGTAYSVLGATLGSYVVFRLSRRYGRPFVERAVDADALAQFDRFSDEHGYLVLFLFILVPGVPDDVLCFVAGTTDLDVRRMTLLTAVARVPSYFALNLAGASVAAARYLETAVIVGVLVAASLVVYLKREALVGRLLGPRE